MQCAPLIRCGNGVPFLVEFNAHGSKKQSSSSSRQRSGWHFGPKLNQGKQQWVPGWLRLACTAYSASLAHCACHLEYCPAQMLSATSCCRSHGCAAVDISFLLTDAPSTCAACATALQSPTLHMCISSSSSIGCVTSQKLMCRTCKLLSEISQLGSASEQPSEQMRMHSGC